MAATCMHTVFSCTNTGIVGSNPTRGKDACLRIFCVVLYRMSAYLLWSCTMYRISAYLLCCLVQCTEYLRIFCAILYNVQNICVSSVLSCTMYRMSAYLLCCLVQCTEYLRIFCAVLYNVQNICVSSVLYKMSSEGPISRLKVIYRFYEGFIFSEVNCQWEEARRPNS
jgi:hypothetical protein